MTAFYKFCANINGAIKRRQVSVQTENSNIVYQIAVFLANEGFIRGITKININNKHKLELHLAYYHTQPVLKQIIPVSKPGRKVFSTIRALKLLKIKMFSRNKTKFFMKIRYARVLLSTSKGILTENQAIIRNIGGLILCKIYS